MQPSTSHDTGHKRKSSMEDYSSRDGNAFVASHLAALGHATSLRHVRMKSDRTAKDASGHPPISSITVSAVRKAAEDYMPYLSGSKTTTITPILGNHSKHYPASISEIIDLVDSDNEGHSGGNVPNMKKRKLDILRQGGLEVTAISHNKSGQMAHNSRGAHASSLVIPPVNVSKMNGTKANTSTISAQTSVPKPRFQSTSMYSNTSCVFGNPKDLIQPAQATEYNCIDLTVEKCDPTLRIRLPESTTIQKAHTFSPFAAHHQKLADPNLQITLVPPLQSAHTSHTFSTKRRPTDNSKLSTPTATISLGGDKATVTPLPSALITTPSARISATSSTTSACDADNLPVLPVPTILNVPNMNDLKINQLFLQNMLDPMYLTNFYNNPSLLFQQSLPPEILQGLGIIPISKS